jgi:hypothetical protein
VLVYRDDGRVAVAETELRRSSRNKKLPARRQTKCSRF